MNDISSTAIDLLAYKDSSGQHLAWIFPCCSAKWEPGLSEPVITSQSFNSAGHYNATSFGICIPISEWVGGDELKDRIKTALIAWKNEKMPRL